MHYKLKTEVRKHVDRFDETISYCVKPDYNAPVKVSKRENTTHRNRKNVGFGRQPIKTRSNHSNYDYRNKPYSTYSRGHESDSYRQIRDIGELGEGEGEGGDLCCDCECLYENGNLIGNVYGDLYGNIKAMHNNKINITGDVFYTGNVVPVTNNTCDLGKLDSKWKKVHAEEFIVTNLTADTVCGNLTTDNLVAKSDMNIKL